MRDGWGLVGSGDASLPVASREGRPYSSVLQRLKAGTGRTPGFWGGVQPSAAGAHARGVGEQPGTEVERGGTVPVTHDGGDLQKTKCPPDGSQNPLVFLRFFGLVPPKRGCQLACPPAAAPPTVRLHSDPARMLALWDMDGKPGDIDNS